GFECKVIGNGEANISGVRSIDAFFSATLTLKEQTAALQAEVDANLGEIAAALGLDAGGTIDAKATAIAGYVSGGFDGAIQGDLRLAFEPAKCSVSAKASVEAAAKCDADIDPGMATVSCKGECVAEASAMAECSGSAMLQCKGTAPSFACEGS